MRQWSGISIKLHNMKVELNQSRDYHLSDGSQQRLMHFKVERLVKKNISSPLIIIIPKIVNN